MAQHISRGEVILVVFPSCGIWTLGRGAGRGWAEDRDSPGGVLLLLSLMGWVGATSQEGHAHCPLLALSPRVSPSFCVGSHKL